MHKHNIKKSKKADRVKKTKKTAHQELNYIHELRTPDAT